MQGFSAQDFTRVNTGVIQGCPLSPLLSLLIGQAWATYSVFSHQCDGLHR